MIKKIIYCNTMLHLLTLLVKILGSVLCYFSPDYQHNSMLIVGKYSPRLNDGSLMIFRHHDGAKGILIW